jgi:hypothetical protein
MKHLFLSASLLITTILSCSFEDVADSFSKNPIPEFSNPLELYGVELGTAINSESFIDSSNPLILLIQGESCYSLFKFSVSDYVWMEESTDSVSILGFPEAFKMINLEGNDVAAAIVFKLTNKGLDSSLNDIYSITNNGKLDKYLFTEELSVLKDMISEKYGAPVTDTQDHNGGTYHDTSWESGLITIALQTSVNIEASEAMRKHTGHNVGVWEAELIYRYTKTEHTKVFGEYIPE